MASRQVKWMQNLLAQAKTGNENAVKLLRECIHKAADAAPPNDLIIMAETLVGIGARLSWEDEHRN